MGTFRVEIEIGDAAGERWETVETLVDTGAMYTTAPAPLLRRLGVAPTHATPSSWQTAGTSSMTSAEAGFV
jgi:predicted aspartyl protease